ncbi:MAG: ACT domain-containing protein [Clostridiales bacterium]|nr:ACT domain-containing protein [Clostridiales bacterium]
MKKAVVTVLGFDRKGIIAKVSAVLYECDANILDISQTIVSGLFNMVLVADISSPECPFDAISSRLSKLAEDLGLQIRVQRSEIFEAMHQI